jgi:heme-degrading monooxygenase HmoA
VTAPGLCEVWSAMKQVLRAAAPKQKPRTAGGPIMIMRMTWGKLRPGTWQDFERAYNATVAGKAVKGLRGRWLAQDVNDPNGGFAVSLWDTLEDMQAYEQSAVFKQEIQPTLQPFFVGEYHTYRCDVKYSQ